MSLSANYPALAPNLILDFANSNRVDPRITVTRASTATFYDGVTFAKAEENLFLNSQGPAANWITGNVTLTGNNAAAPDGTTTATLANDGAVTGVHIAYSSATALLASTTYTISAYLKNVTRTYAVLSIAGNSNNYGAVEFNLSTGAVSRTSNVTATINSSSITAVGSSWYRCVVTVTVGASVTTPRSYVSMSDGVAAFDSFGRPSYAGGGLEILIWGIQLEQRSAATAYTVTTTQPITNYIQALQTAQNNVPRIDHSPTTTATLGLLVEESRTNSLLRSAEFDNASWTKQNVTVTANATIAPDGTVTADKLIPSTTPATQQISQLGVVASQTCAMSIYAKADGVNTFEILDGASGANGGTFDLLNVTATNKGTGQASIVAVGNGWYRCIAVATTTGFRLYCPSSLASASGNGFSGVFLWGAQLEAGAFATSYIPTVAATVTRQADAISMTGTAFSGWYNPAGGTVYGAYQISFTSGNRYLLTIEQNAQNYVELIGNTTGNRTGLNNRSSNVLDVNFTGSTAVSLTSRNQTAIAVANNDFVLYLNGTLQGSDTSATLTSTLNTLEIGRYNEGSPGGYFNGTIQRIAYYPLRNTNAQLQALTGT